MTTGAGGGGSFDLLALGAAGAGVGFPFFSGEEASAGGFCLGFLGAGFAALGLLSCLTEAGFAVALVLEADGALPLDGLVFVFKRLALCTY